MRVANSTMKNEMVNNLKTNYRNMQKIQKQMMTGKKTFVPSDNPINAINSIYSRIRINQINQYEKNISDSKSMINVIHDKISSTVNILQRVREISVQAANGIYTREDRQAMGIEVEELMKEAISLANSQFEDQYVFAGSKIRNKPFNAIYENSVEAGKEIISKIEYTGDKQIKEIEINTGDKIKVSFSGANLFWGTENVVVSLKDSRDFIAQQDSIIRIDNYEVKIDIGDNLQTVINKINELVPSVKAFKEQLQNGNEVIGFSSSYPHQIIFEDIEGSKVLQDLGVITNSKNIAQNLHANTLQKGGALFDILLRFRDSLIQNNSETIGTRDLADLSSSLDNILKKQAEISAIQSRLHIQENDFAVEKVHLIEKRSLNEDVDLAEASIQFSTIQNIHQIALQTAAKYIRPTLLDYL